METVYFDQRSVLEDAGDKQVALLIFRIIFQRVVCTGDGYDENVGATNRITVKYEWHSVRFFLVIHKYRNHLVSSFVNKSIFICMFSM